MKPETVFRKLILAGLPKPDWLWTPLESRGTIDGVPDLHWAHSPTRTDGWLEAKVTEGWQVRLLPHQCAWLTTRARAGLRTVVAVRQLGKGRDDLWLLDGALAAHWQAQGLPRLPAPPQPTQGVLGRFTGGPKGWPWAAVAGLLTQPHTAGA